MCLIVFGWDIHPKYKLILAANRDEFYNRPTAAAGFWKDHPEILGGRDLKAGGSWLTISKKGKIAAVTNFRDINSLVLNAYSRGEIPVNFLTSDKSPSQYIETLHSNLEKYNGFNVLLGTRGNMAHYSNHERKLNIIEPGIHGLSNALLNTNWPKVDRAKTKFQDIINNQFDYHDLIKMMGDTETAEDSVLPDTGVSQEWEKALSAMCIRTENYGTCCTTVITIDRLGKVEFTEKSFPGGIEAGEPVHCEFDIEP